MESKRFWWWLNCLLHMCWIMHWVMFSQEQNRRERLMRGRWNDECPLFCLPEMVNNSRPYQRRKQVCFISFLFNTYSTGGSGWLPLMVNILPVEGWQFIPIIFQGFKHHPLKLGSSHPSIFATPRGHGERSKIWFLTRHRHRRLRHQLILWDRRSCQRIFGHIRVTTHVTKT